MDFDDKLYDIIAADDTGMGNNDDTDIGEKGGEAGEMTEEERRKKRRKGGFGSDTETNDTGMGSDFEENNQ